MKIVETKLKGSFIIEPKIYEDDRGYFFESYNSETLKTSTGIDIIFHQDNEAKSKYGVIRGLHLQRSPSFQTKLVRCLKGKILDVAVDVRKNSPTYGQYISVELSGNNKKQLFVPHGFAHGYSVLSESATVAYKCDNLYDKASEDGIYMFDKDLDINWGIPQDHVIISEKDQNQMKFKDFVAIQL